MFLSKILINKDYVERGQLFSKSDILAMPGFEIYSTALLDDWTINPFANRSWQWRLNWLSFLSYLVAYHASSKFDVALDKGRDAIQSWLNKYLLTDESCDFEFVWHDHGTALRAEQILIFLNYISQYAPAWKDNNQTFFEYAQLACRIHAAWLAKDSFYSAHTNHGLEQTRILLLLSLAFPEEPSALNWRILALERLNSELDYAFTEEGVHVENSPSYHIFVFKVFIGIFADYSSDVLGGLAEKFEVFATRALEFTTRILRPDGLLPIIGDTEQLSTSDSYQELFGNSQEYAHFYFANTQGKRGEKPTKLNRVYQKSGYAIFRDAWLDASAYRQTFHLVVKAGCLSRYHHQQDEGHLLLYALGEDWLIDSGLYNYNQTDPIRKYMRSRQAHNVASISNTRYATDFEHRMANWSINDFDDSDDFPFVEMDLQVLESVRQLRRVSFDNKQAVVTVGDDFFMLDGLERDVTLLWHVPQDKKINILNDGSLQILSKTGHSLRLNITGSKPDDILVRKGIIGERVFSCVSLKTNQYDDSYVIQLNFKARKMLKVQCVFSVECAKNG
jgi:Heparinase II/III N-terminus/Heparinase II/III-like protein